MEGVFASTGVALFLALTGFSGLASAADASDDAPTTVDSIGDYVVVRDLSGERRAVTSLNATVDAWNRTVSVNVGDRDSEPLYVLLKETWVRSFIPDPAFSNATFTMTTESDTQWFRVAVEKPVAGLSFNVSEFRPSLGKSLYSSGSPKSIQMERPMLVTLAEVPRVETERVERSNGNGTWTEEVPVPIRRLGIRFEDADTGGQRVTLNRTWLGQYGLTTPYFQYADGTGIENKSDAYSFHLFPAHFSVLYVFTTDEGFTKESDQAWSDVRWDTGNRNLYVLSDRRDPQSTSEMMRSPAPATYDPTTSFTVRATWQTSQQGNWQTAVPLFFMAASNTYIDQANSVYVLYYSRDSNLGYQPWYYLRYRDGGGVLRVNQQFATSANVQLELLFAYDGYTRQLTLSGYDAAGNTLASTGYSLGISESFSVAKVGTAACSCVSDHTSEPTVIAKTDALFLDANMARNGNFEVDGNGDNIPDQWQKWKWSDGKVYRSSEQAKFGTWSVKIPDSSSTKLYGLQTLRMTAAAGQSYVGSAWVYVAQASGWNAICVEFWDAAGARLAAACRNTNTAWNLLWQYLDITAFAPTGTATVDLLVYSAPSNTGTAYFDGAELKRSRSAWAIQVHPNHLPDSAAWIRALEYVTDLGIPNIRIPFVWDQFEPSRDDPNEDHVAYWHTVVQVARARGIGIIGVIQRVPTWARNVDPASMWEELREFTRTLATEYGSDVQYYQLFNEENHPDHRQFEHVHEGQPRAFLEAFYGLLEGTGLGAWEHKSRFKTIVNMYADILPPWEPAWDSYLRDILRDAYGNTAIDVVAIDHYPGTWCCTSYRDWAALETLLDIAVDYGKEMAVMETGFSTEFDGWGHGQDDQERFVDEALDEILIRRNSLLSTNPQNALLLVSWYEFLDDDTEGGPNPLSHFGILEYHPPSGEWRLKLAYDNLRSQVSRWT